MRITKDECILLTMLLENISGEELIKDWSFTNKMLFQDKVEDVIGTLKAKIKANAKDSRQSNWTRQIEETHNVFHTVRRLAKKYKV